MWIVVLVGVLVCISFFSMLICVQSYSIASSYKSKLESFTQVTEIQNSLLATLSQQNEDFYKRISEHADNFKIVNENFEVINNSISVISKEILNIKNENDLAEEDGNEIN